MYLWHFVQVYFGLTCMKRLVHLYLWYICIIIVFWLLTDMYSVLNLATVKATLSSFFQIFLVEICSNTSLNVKRCCQRLQWLPDSLNILAAVQRYHLLTGQTGQIISACLLSFVAFLFIVIWLTNTWGVGWIIYLNSERSGLGGMLHILGLISSSILAQIICRLGFSVMNYTI